MPCLPVILNRLRMRCVLLFVFFGISISAWSDTVLESCYKDVLSGSERAEIFEWIKAWRDFSDIESKAASAVCALAVDDYAAALENINLVVSQDESFPFAMELRGRIYMESGEFSKAVKDFNRSIYLGSGSGDEYYYAARSYYLGGYATEALEILRSRVDFFEKQLPVSEGASRESFEEVNVYRLLGEITYSSGDVRLAIDSLERGFLRNSLSIDLFNSLLELLLRFNARSESDFYIDTYCARPLLESSVYCKR